MLPFVVVSEGVVQVIVQAVYIHSHPSISQRKPNLHTPITRTSWARGRRKLAKHIHEVIVIASIVQIVLDPGFNGEHWGEGEVVVGVDVVQAVVGVHVLTK